MEELLGTPRGSRLSPPNHHPPAHQAAAQVLPPGRLEEPQPQPLCVDRPPQLSLIQVTQVDKSRVKTTQVPAVHGEAFGALSVPPLSAHAAGAAPGLSSFIS